MRVRLYLLVVIMAIAHLCIAQTDDECRFKVTGTVFSDDDSGDGIMIVPSQEYDKPSGFFFHGEGFSVICCRDKEYLLNFKKNGYISQDLLINTKNIPDDFWEEGFMPFPLDLDLKETTEDAEQKYSEPIGIVRFQENIGDFDFFPNYPGKRTLIDGKPRKSTNIIVNQ